MVVYFVTSKSIWQCRT